MFGEKIIIYSQTLPNSFFEGRILEQGQDTILFETNKNVHIDLETTYQIKIKKDETNLFLVTKLERIDSKENIFKFEFNELKLNKRAYTRIELDKENIASVKILQDVDSDVEINGFESRIDKISENGIEITTDISNFNKLTITDIKFIKITFKLEDEYYKDILCEIKNVRFNKKDEQAVLGCRFMGFYGDERDKIIEYIESRKKF